MSSSEPGSGPPQRGDWLRRHAVGRERPWALEEQLLAPSRAPERERRLAALTARLLEERTQLTRLQQQVGERVARLAALEEELQQLVERPKLPEPPWEPVATSSREPAALPIVELGTSNGPKERDYWLCRCHGFRVEAGEHAVGTVEGVRYASSSSRPDVIEVRAGPFGRRSLLIPVDDVEDIIEEEETVLVRPSVLGETDIAHALLARLRGRFGHQVVT